LGARSRFLEAIAVLMRWHLRIETKIRVEWYSALNVNKVLVFNYLVRTETLRYFEDYPAAHDTIAIAVEEVKRWKPLRITCEDQWLTVKHSLCDLNIFIVQLPTSYTLLKGSLTASQYSPNQTASSRLNPLGSPFSHNHRLDLPNWCPISSHDLPI